MRNGARAKQIGSGTSQLELFSKTRTLSDRAQNSANRDVPSQPLARLPDPFYDDINGNLSCTSYSKKVDDRYMDGLSPPLSQSQKSTHPAQLPDQKSQIITPFNDNRDDLACANGKGKTEPDPASRQSERDLAAYDFSRLKPRQHELRSFQKEAILFSLENKIGIIKLGTGTGKTEIEFYLAAEAMIRGKVLLVADKVNLCQQHDREAQKEGIGFEKSKVKVCLATGDSKERKADPAAFYEGSDLIIGTPETFVIDIRKGVLDLGKCALVIFDEVHHSVGNDAYASMVRSCIQAKVPRLGLSASPAENKRSLEELLDLFKTSNIFNGNEAEIGRYFSHPSSTTVSIELERKRIDALKLLAQMGSGFMDDIMETAIESENREIAVCADKLIEKADPMPGIRDLETLGRIIDASINCQRSGGLDYTPESKALYNARSLHASVFKIQRAYTYLERVSTSDFLDYSKKLRAEARRDIKASLAIIEDRRFIRCLGMCSDLQEHPKLGFVIKTLSETNGQSIIFVETQEFARRLAGILNSGLHDGRALARAYVGKKGMPSKEQERIRAEFESGRVHTLVATSAAEEGLHLPQVKLIINYCVPNSLKSDEQRRGRLRGAGQVYTLVSDRGMEGSGEIVNLYSINARRRSLHKEFQKMLGTQDGG